MANIELANCTNTLLEEIACPTMRRRDIAKTYALAIRSSETVEWDRVNTAIIERWSPIPVVYSGPRAKIGG